MRNENADVTVSEFSSLTAEIKRLDKKISEQNRRANEIEDELCKKFDQIAKDLEKQADQRIKWLNHQYARMRDVADAHCKHFVKECELWQQLQAGRSGQDILSSQLQNMLDEANKKLAERDTENNLLRTELNNCRVELQTSRELASSTKLRQLNELVMTEEIRAVISRLKEDQAAIAEHAKKQDTVTVCSSAHDADATGETNKLEVKSSISPG